VFSVRFLNRFRRVKTTTESTDSGDDEIADLRHAVNAADRLVFLGFAYHRQNMQLLWPQNAPRRENGRVFGTSKGFSDSDALLIANEIASLSGVAGPVILRDLTCNDLFHEYSRSLSLS